MYYLSDRECILKSGMSAIMAAFGAIAILVGEHIKE